MYDDYGAQYSGADAYQEMMKQQQMAEEYRRDCREVQKEEAKNEIRVNAKLHLNEIKMLQKEAEEERKRGVYEQVSMDENGQVVVTTRNLQIQAADRKLTNMRMPKLYALRKEGDVVAAAYLLACQVAGEDKEILLDAKKLGNGTYVLGKLASGGILIMAKTAKAKEYARQLVALLLGRGVHEIVVYNEPGWVKSEEGKFQFIGEGTLTWDRLTKLV